LIRVVIVTQEQCRKGKFTGQRASGLPFAGEAIGAPAAIANALFDALMSLGFSSFRWKLIA
jgi:hypothetical protein